jgi:hypothetical protein
MDSSLSRAVSRFLAASLTSPEVDDGALSSRLLSMSKLALACQSLPPAAQAAELFDRAGVDPADDDELDHAVRALASLGALGAFPSCEARARRLAATRQTAQAPFEELNLRRRPRSKPS